jgi:NADPH-dependent 7-cyano-7-deazaguanine reductase QueF-like protein
VLPRIQSPTLVLHGDADALVPIACGEDTARRIPGSQFIAVPGMGHDLPPEVCTILANHIAPFAHDADAARQDQRHELDPQNPAPTNPNTPEQSQLGRASAYADRYDPTLLFPIARATQREAMGIKPDALPFFGADLWTAFELSWLNPRGKPQLAIAHFTIPCETPNIIESKSFKLYLNSFNNSALRERRRGARARCAPTWPKPPGAAATVRAASA